VLLTHVTNVVEMLLELQLVISLSIDVRTRYNFFLFRH